MPVSFFIIFVTLSYIYIILLGIISKDDEGPNAREFLSFFFLSLLLYVIFIIYY